MGRGNSFRDSKLGPSRASCVLGSTRTHQDILDRRWPGVVLAYSPRRGRFFLQDRRHPNPRKWHIVTMFREGYFPRIGHMMELLTKANVSGFRNFFERELWYKQRFARDEDEEIDNLARRQDAERMAREAIQTLRTVTGKRVVVPMDSWRQKP